MNLDEVKKEIWGHFIEAIRVNAKCKKVENIIGSVKKLEPMFMNAAQIAIPAGYALVPVEPTDEMVDAAEEAYMPFGDMKLALMMSAIAAQNKCTVQQKQYPLSEEEIFNIYCQSDSVMDTCTTNLTRFARAIEKHHRIT